MDALAPPLIEKAALLRQLIASMGHVAVAFSGGVDSSYLLASAIDVLGPERVIAFTADSPLLPRAELQFASSLAHSLGADHRVVSFDELAIADVASNPPRRCYHCKRARFEALLALAAQCGGYTLVHGENADDALDYRPGTQAAQELGVRAPLAEAGLCKSEIRQLSRARGLATWDHPSAACLASRFPYFTHLSREGLQRVEQAERALRSLLPVRQLRIRDHHPVARIEVPADQIATLAESTVRARICDALHAVGYLYVALDLEGYRMGSLNDEIKS